VDICTKKGDAYRLPNAKDLKEYYHQSPVCLIHFWLSFILVKFNDCYFLMLVFQAYEELQQRLSEKVQPPPEAKAALMSYHDSYARGLFTQIVQCTKQASVSLTRNKRILYSRIFRAVVIGFLLGTLFWLMPLTGSGGQNRVSLIFFCITFTAMGAIASIPQIFDERRLFEQQRSLHFYRTFAYFISSITVDIPISIIETVIFTLFVYWMSGLNPTDYGARYFMFLLILFITNMCAKQFCRVCSAISPTMGLASSLAPAILCIFLVFAGFLIPSTSMPKCKFYYYC
jgi:ABC-type multidrug transport system permease subunit